MIDHELRRGWGVILASSIGVMCSCITFVNYSLGVFVIPLGDEFGWRRAEVLLATTFVTSGALVTSFVAGWLADKSRIGLIIIFSQLGFGLAFISLAIFVDNLTTFYIIYLSMAVLAGGTLPITFTKIIAEQFVRRRGLAIGLTLAGTGLAGFIVPPFIGFFVNQYGWRVGYVAAAALPILVALPLSVAFLRKKATGSGPRGDDQPQAAAYGMNVMEALRSWRYWVIAIAFFIASGAATGVSANIVPMMTDRGFSPQTAANLAGVFGLAVIAGRVLIGVLADIFWAPPLAFVFLVPAAAATVMLATVSLDTPSAAALLIVVGLATGAEGDLLSYLVARYFGTKAYGRIFSGIFVAFIAAIAISAPLFGFAFDVTKSYALAMEIAAAGWVLCGCLLLTLGRYPNWDNDQGARI